MTILTPIQMFACPETGKLYKTERGALASAKRAKEAREKVEAEEKEKQKSLEEVEKEVNWLRLNLEDVKDLPKLMKSRAKELYDWDLDVRLHNLYFCNVSNSHNCPINGVTNWCEIDVDKPTHYLGWSGRITGMLRGAVPKLTFMNSIADAIKLKFKGMHTGTGNPGSPNEYSMDIGFNMFLDDFPKLKEKYEIYENESIKHNKNTLNFNKLNNEAHEFAKNHPDYKKAQALLEKVRSIRDIRYNNLFDEYRNQNKVELIPVSDDYGYLSKMFSSSPSYPF